MKDKTAQLQEEMKDGAEFERLATLVLRKADKRFDAILHLGINAYGQPISAPNDGFCKVPESDPPQFIWVQHTTESRNRLRVKWLSEDTVNLGDLAKAVREANKLQIDFPLGKFLVILSTNQRLPTEKNKSLAQDIYTIAKQKGVEVIIWEQSQYRDFLTSNPEGQWIRKEFFGTEANRLSHSLLAHLSQTSLTEYQKQQFTMPTSWVERQFEERITLDSTINAYTVKLILGESGFGKSAMAYRFLDKHIKAGGYGLYIPEKIVENAISLADALRQIFLGLCPSLAPDEVENIPKYLSTDLPFIIVVDDVNKASNPPELIDKLVSWGQQPYLIICLPWPRFWMQPNNHKPKVDVISIDRMPFDEAIKAVERVTEVAGRSITIIEARRIAGELRGDPLLIGTFGASFLDDANIDILFLINNVVENYLGKYIKQAAEKSNGKYFEHEYNEVLLALAKTMLTEKTLYPHWRTIEGWLEGQPHYINILRDISSQRKICQVTPDGGLRFQHDRFLEHFFVQSINYMLTSLNEYHDILSEPYYAEWVGQALAKNTYPENIINQILKINPLALAFSIQIFKIPITESHHKIVEKVKYWVKNSGANWRTPKALRGAIANCFINTDSPVILDIVQTDFGLEIPWLGDFARLRNGDLDSGVRFFAQVGSIYRQDPFVIELLEHAKKYHGEGLRSKLLQVLLTPSKESVFSGTVLLAGHLGFADLEEAIMSSWQQQTKLATYLSIVIWAVLRSNENIQQNNSFIDTLIKYWGEVPDSQDDKESYQLSVARGLSYLLGNKVNKSVIQYLIAQTQKYPQLKKAIAYICGAIDFPESIEFATNQVHLEKEWLASPLATWAYSAKRLSSDSVLILQTIWQTEETINEVRKIAFQLWLNNVDRLKTNILPFIQSILPNSPFYIRALYERAFLGDQTCIPAVIENWDANSYLYCALSPIWNKNLKEAVSIQLGTLSKNLPTDFSGGFLNEHFHLADMLTEIPSADAEELLSKHWDHLRYSPLFLHVAIFIGSSKTLLLASEVINDYPSDVNPFKYLSAVYDVYDSQKKTKIDLTHLKNLEAYMAYLHDEEKSILASFCYQQGGEYVEWSIRCFSQEINDRWRLHYMPSAEDVLQLLNSETTHLRNHALYVLEKFQKNHDPLEFLRILRQWLEDKPTWGKVVAAGSCIELIGLRTDVTILDVPLESEWAKHNIKTVKESTWFSICRRTLV